MGIITVNSGAISSSLFFEVTNGGEYPSSANPVESDWPVGSFQITGTTSYYIWLYVEVPSGATTTAGASKQSCSVDIKNVDGTTVSLNAQAPPGSRVYSAQHILAPQNTSNNSFYIDTTNSWQPFGGFSSWVSGFAFNTVDDPSTATDLFVQQV